MGRLVFIPQSFVHSHSHTLNVNGQTISGNSFDELEYQPKKVAETFYRLREMTDNFTIWTPESPGDVYRVEKWIAKNCSRDVIAIPASDGRGSGDRVLTFELYFLDGWPARDKFNQRHQEEEPRQEFDLALPERLTATEAIAWADEHMTKGYDVVAFSPTRLVFTIHDENQAVNFKLRWSDYFCLTR